MPRGNKPSPGGPFQESKQTEKSLDAHVNAVTSPSHPNDAVTSPSTFCRSQHKDVGQTVPKRGQSPVWELYVLQRRPPLL